MIYCILNEQANANAFCTIGALIALKSSFLYGKFMERPKIKKTKSILLNDRYKTANTSMLTFHFEPCAFPASESKLKNCKIHHESIGGKDLYLIDRFFSESELEDLYTYTKQATFSRFSYASHASREQGEEPARSMNNKEKWEFFAKPPFAMNEIFKLLNTLSETLHADITTHPWDLCDEKICGSALATNRVEKVSYESMEKGKHDDYNPQEGIPFGIPLLYGAPGEIHPSCFINGERGRPWLVTLMLYATEKEYLPEYGMGTIFCKAGGELAARASCIHGRFVLFEGDIVHSIEESKIPNGVAMWRVSYVLKLLVNPKVENQSVKEGFFDLKHE